MFFIVVCFLYCYYLRCFVIQKYTYLFICQGVSENFFSLIFNHLQNEAKIFPKIGRKFRGISGFSAKNVRDVCATKRGEQGVSGSATATEKALHHLYY